MKNRKYEDTIFLSSELALKEALKNNKLETIEGFNESACPQICYYVSENAISDSPSNCIHVPLEKFYNYFVTTKNRLPKRIEASGTDYSSQDIYILSTALNTYLDAAVLERKKLERVYETEIINQKPDFNDEKLRVFIPTIRESVVLKHVSKNVADAFEKIGCEVLYYLPDELSSQHILPKLHYQYEFNPHIVFTLNFLGNEILNNDTFHFCWMQDPMPILYNDKKIELRKRDYILSLLEEFTQSLIKKGIAKEKIIPQTFSTNPKIFFEKNNIKRTNKIVFLGSSYDLEKENNIAHELIEIFIEHFEKNTLTNEIIESLVKEYRVNYNIITMKVLPAIIRKQAVIWMCKLKNIEIEVYGNEGWLEVEEVKPFYKGLLKYGEEIADVYNSAKYALVSHTQYIYQQRLFEISSCGAIPVAYDSPISNEKFEHYDNILTFQTPTELQELIGKEPKSSPTQISQDISYEKLAQKIVDIVRKNSNG